MAFVVWARQRERYRFVSVSAEALGKGGVLLQFQAFVSLMGWVQFSHQVQLQFQPLSFVGLWGFRV